MPSHPNGDGEKILLDIIDLLKTTDPDDVPDFVAKELQKLPHVTFDHIEDISLKVRLKLKTSDVVVGVLRVDAELYRYGVNVPVDLKT